MKLIKNFWPLGLLLLLSYPAIRHLFLPGFFPIHDDTQVARVYEMAKALKDGMFPVRWVADLGYGYGYPIFNFYAPLVYYIGAFLNMLGFDVLTATKLMMALGMAISAVAMYILGKEVWGKIGAIVCALFYMYAPYHAVQLYVRGDVAEVFAYGFIPLAFYGLIKISKQVSVWYLLLTSIGFAVIILSHNLTALMLSPFLIVFILYLYLVNRNMHVVYLQTVGMLGGILLASFYWIPTLFQMQYTNVLSQIGASADFRDHFVCLRQLWESNWGFGGSTIGCIDGMSFRIGKVHILSVIFVLITILFSIRLRNLRFKDVSLLLFALGGFSMSIFLMLEVSQPVWETIQPMKFIQYPWRFLILASFFSSLLAGRLLVWVFTTGKSGVKDSIYVVVIVGIIFYLYAKLFVPQTLLLKPLSYYTDLSLLRWDISKISDEYLPPDFQKPTSADEIPTEKIEIIQGDAKIEMIENKTHRVSARIQTHEDLLLKINTAYFPAWKVYLNDIPVSVEMGKKGFTVLIPQGEHTLHARFIETPVEKTANLLSIAGITLVLLGIIYRKRIA